MKSFSRIAAFTALRRAMPEMRSARVPRSASKRAEFPYWGAAGLLLSALVAGCATPSLPKLTTGKTVAAHPAPDTKRPVQSIRLAPATVDGQTSWIIEPEVPRIPKVAGLDHQLPPHIEQQLSRAFDLAQRGATYSANSEFRAVLGLCALELDSRDGGTAHRDALRQGLVALDEADDLAGDHTNGRGAADVRPEVAGHDTPVLQAESQPAVDSIEAVQAYYAYAEERFAFACEGSPGASLAFYGLGRTFVVPGSHYTHAAGKSAMLQRVAMRIAPQNVLAANELGVLLAQHGHLDEAEGLFRQCVATNATPESWRNLAVVYSRKGDEVASQAALAAGARLTAEKSKQAVVAQAPPAQAEPQPSLARSEPPAPKQDTIEEPTPPSETAEPRGFWSKISIASKLSNPLRR